MYKIMLADDEGIVIDSLKFIIEKEFKDICEVQYAKTGRSVIELGFFLNYPFLLLGLYENYSIIKVSIAITET